MDIPAVVRQQYWISPAVGPGPLFSATKRAARKLTQLFRIPDPKL
jgi:hypothetical protein